MTRLATQNPPFNIPDYFVVWLAGRTLFEAHLKHPKQPDHSIEGIVPLREATLNVLTEAIRKHDVVVVSPTKK